MTAVFLLILALLAQQGLALGFLWGGPLTVFHWLGFRYVPPVYHILPADQNNCRNCREARFWFPLPPSQETKPCCTTWAPAPAPAQAPAPASAPAPAPFKCGEEGGRRIVGGVQSTAGRYPWTVVYQDVGKPPGGCAGTLVAAEWVVTAAHCVRGLSSGDSTKENLLLILGEFDISSSSDSADTNRKVVRLAMDPIVHENYNIPGEYSNDIALIKLAEKVDLKIYSPACLPVAKTDYTGKTGSVYGWGATIGGFENGAGVNIMREVEVAIVSDTTCSAALAISEDMLCAGARGKDACIGDSGGPFTVKNAGNQHELVGVVSWGLGCAVDGLYGVYSEVAMLRTWIDREITANGGATFVPT